MVMESHVVVAEEVDGLHNAEMLGFLAVLDLDVADVMEGSLNASELDTGPDLLKVPNVGVVHQSDQLVAVEAEGALLVHDFVSFL